MEWAPAAGAAERSSSAAAPQQQLLRRASGGALILSSSGRRLFYRELLLGANSLSTAAPVLIPASPAVKHAPLSGPSEVSSLVLSTEAPPSTLTDVLRAPPAGDNSCAPAPPAAADEQIRFAMQSVAAYELGWRCLNGAGGVGQDDKAAAYWLRAGASTGHAGAKCAQWAQDAAC